MKSDTIVTRTDAWPIVVATIWGIDHTEDAIARALNQWIAYTPLGPHALVVDLTHGHAGTTANQRAQIAGRTLALVRDKDIRPLLCNQVAVVLVFRNPVVHGVITAVHWLLPGVKPYLSAPTMEQALRLAAAELAKAGVQLEPAVAERVLACGTRLPSPAL